MESRLVELLKQTGVIDMEPVKLKNAGFADFYLDIKKAYGYPEVLNCIADELWFKINKNITCIAAAGYGGLPPASIISSVNDLKLALVREELKNHGKTRYIDGYIPDEKDKIVIVDDVFTTGKSLRKTIEILNQTGAKITECCVVVKRGNGKLAVPLKYLLTPEELI